MAFKTNNIATLSDIKGRNDIEVEVNKNNINDYVEFKVRGLDKNWIKSYIEIRELYGLIFLLVGKKEQEELMPIRQTEVRTYVRQHRIKLTKDMKKGEIVVANCRVSVPLIIEDRIRGMIGKKKSSGILVP